MSIFRFRMQNILNLKQKIEDQKKIEYSKALAALAREEEILELLNNRKREYEDAFRGIFRDVAKVIDIKDARVAVVRMEEYIKTQKIAVKRAEDDAEFARSELEEAMKERKTYERLREKAFEDFMIEENRAESKEIDQLVSYTYSKQSVSPL